MKKLKFSAFFLLAFSFFISCNKEEYKAPVSKTVEMSGRWWVQLFTDPDNSGVLDPDNIIIAYEDFATYAITTYNTAANGSDSIFIDDAHAPIRPIVLRWPFKCTVPVNLSDLTLKPATVLNVDPLVLENDPGATVTVVEGKILKGAAHSKSGRVADSIYVKLEFSDDEGNYYIYSGHRDSGQEDDQY